MNAKHLNSQLERLPGEVKNLDRKIPGYFYIHLTHWGRVTHIWVSTLAIIGSDAGLSPGRRQAIVKTNAKILLIRSFETNCSKILSKIQAFSFNKNAFEYIVYEIGS